MPNEPKAKKQKHAAKHDSAVMWSLFDHATGSRARLKPEIARAFFVLCQSLADEHDTSADGVVRSMAAGSSVGMAQHAFHKNAASAFRMMSDRVLKTFEVFKLIAVEKAVGPLYIKSVDRLSRPHQAKSKPVLPPSSGESY